MQIPYQAQLAYGWTSLAVKTNIVSILVILPLLWFLIPIYGAIGAASVWVFLNVGYILLGVQFMYKRILPTEKLRWYIQDILQPVAVAILVAWLTSLAISSDSSLALQGFEVLLAFCVTLAASALTASLTRSYAISWIYRCLGVARRA
jgi:hypothetical protein